MGKTVSILLRAQDCELWPPSLIKGCQSLWLHAMSRAGFMATIAQTHAHTDTAERCLKALGLSQEQQTSNTSVDWHTPQHNVCSAKQKETWWHINLNMLPGCAGRMLFLTYLQNPLSDWVECGPWCWLSHWVLAIHKTHLECVKSQTEHTACVWLQTFTPVPDTQSACGGRELAEATNKRCEGVLVCMFVR